MALQSRPEPMNASPHHPKVKVSMKFSDSVFHAGGEISGKMQLECKTDKGLGIGIIMVELFAIEELTSRDHSATSTFMHSRRIFQGPGLPPSNAVHTDTIIPVLPTNYYPARQGITTFLFKFQLPKSCPSSIAFGSGLARVRYEITASVGVSWKDENRLVTNKKEVDVVECWDEALTHTEPEGVIIGEDAKIWVQGKVVGGFMVAGQAACIELQVKNRSTKKNTSLSVTLTRSLVLPNLLPGQKPVIELSDTLTSVSYKGQEYIIQSGAEGVANLVFDLPKNARGVKGGTRYSNEENRKTPYLFEVRCIAAIKLSMGLGSKDIQLNIPVTILHHSVIPDLPLPDPYAHLPQQLDISLFDPSPAPLYHSVATPLPFVDRPTSPYLPPMSPIQPFSPVLSSYSYAVPSFSPPLAPYADQRVLWSPPPVHYQQPPHHFAPPTRNVDAQTTIPIQSYTTPPRPFSTEPLSSHPFHDLQPEISYTSGHPQPFPLCSVDNDGSERQERKGERASRIAHHLRMSSRNRSASPQSHHYAIAPLPNPHSHFAAAIAMSSHHDAEPLQMPATPHLAETNDYSEPRLSVSPVLSPRPMHSPTHSFKADKSSQVATLERIAAAIGNVLNVQLVPGSSLLDKTLPRLPSTSKTHTIHPDARSLFPGFTDNQAVGDDTRPPTPRTPTLAALKSPRAPRTTQDSLSLGGVLSGLDVLEAKLLAEVGTRKPERTGRHADGSVLPIDIPRARDKPLNDSAISSLTLPGLEPEEGTLRIGRTSDSGRNGKVKTKSKPEEGSLELKVKRSNERVKETTPVSSAKKGKSGRMSGDHWPDVAKDAEMYKLRKAAQGRIAAWLGSIEPSAPAQLGEDPSSGEPKDLEIDGITEEENENATKPQMHSMPSSKDDAIEEATSAAPNPRSSGFVPIGSIQATISRSRFTNSIQTQKHDTPLKTPESSQPFPVPDLLTVSPPTRPGADARYDARSARGGRGGKVTAIAALWASSPQGQGKGPSPANVLPKRDFLVSSGPHAPKRSPTESPVKPSVKPAMRPLLPRLPSGNSSPLSPGPPLASNNKPVSFANLAAKPADIVKSPSVPAVISSSLAKPMLSSTASLARPIPPLLERNKVNVLLPPTVSASISPPKAPPALPKSTGRTELAFGQARLRELIQRYQRDGP